jgi:hypothetical protein
MLAILEGTMRIVLALTCSVFLICGVAAAAELVGVDMPDKVKVGEAELTLNGLGLREATFGIDVYVAGFYLEQPGNDADAILASDQIKQIRMQFVYKKVADKKLTKAWEEGIEANVEGGLERYADQLKQLNGHMETLVKGDTMTFTAIPGKGLLVEVKGVKKDVIADDGFARDFWAIWLGPEPPNAGLKKGMLGVD